MSEHLIRPVAAHEEHENVSIRVAESLDELRAKIIGLIQAPATKVVQVVNAPAAKLARVVQAYAKKDEAA